jgi:hypothetical protein
MELFNLRCMDRQENARDLRRLPVPSVLKLSNTHGGGLFVSLQEVRGEKARLRIGDAEKEVDISDIRALWNGQYTTLEKIDAPPVVQRKTVRKVAALAQGR